MAFKRKLHLPSVPEKKVPVTAYVHPSFKRNKAKYELQLGIVKQILNDPDLQDV